MARAARVKAEPVSPPPPVKEEKEDDLTDDQPQSKRRRTTRSSIKRSVSPLVKVDEEDVKPRKPITPFKKAAADADALRDRKLKAHKQFSGVSIFPDFPRPTSDECKIAHQILQRLHGERVRPEEVVASATRAGCGDSPNVLDALVRTILSQNTSDTNSTRAKLSMDKCYGRSDDWDAIVQGGQPQLEEAIRCGGLSQVKSKVILSILEQAKSKYGTYSLDHLHKASTEDAMSELLSFKGVGPKTASCVLLFCLGREDFAVDTHVWRITGLIGWRPAKANREQTYTHLNERIPDSEKYGLHILLVTHGKQCDECKAGGRSAGKCELRKTMRNKGLDE